MTANDARTALYQLSTDSGKSDVADSAGIFLIMEKINKSENIRSYKCICTNEHQRIISLNYKIYFLTRKHSSSFESRDEKEL